MAEGFRVWIEQDLCTADGSCYNNVPSVFHEGADGIAYVRDAGGVFDGSTKERPAGGDGVALIPGVLLSQVVDEATFCPGECIHIEPADAPM
jgi:ferredoxin